MELKEALVNLDRASAEFRGTRMDHATLQESVQVVAKAFPDSIGPESDGNKKK